MTEQTNKTPKKGLVLGGGGSRGSYTMGVLAALSEQGRSYDLVTGISIGALVGAVYASQDASGLKAWISAFTSQDVARNLFLFPQMKQNPQSDEKPDFNHFVQSFQQYGPSVQPLRENFSRIFNYEKFKASPVDFACLAANLTQNQAKVFKKSEMSKNNAIDCLLASAAYFPAFSFVSIDGNYYGDGGFLNETLGTTALAMGAQDLTIVALSDPDVNVPIQKKQCSLMIRPIVRLSYFLDFDKQILENQIAQGYNEALKYMDLVPGYLYTFYPDDWVLLDTLSKAADHVLKKRGLSFSNKEIIDGMTEILGSRPGVLNNRYMARPQAGLILECLALIAGLDLYRQYHLLDFTKEILQALNNFQVRINNTGCDVFSRMEKDGILDLLFFFRKALQTWPGSLPPSFDILTSKFESVYDLALAWHILEHFAGLLKLF